VITFTGYTVDCIVEGEVELVADRLRDQLNAADQVVINRATLTRLGDGSQLGVPRLILDQEELFAADAGPARGEEARRLHTVLHQRRAEVGPYSILGLMHERPGVAPLGGLRLARPFVAFTDASMAFRVGGEPVVREVEALLVNGRKIAWLGDAGSFYDGSDLDLHRPAQPSLARRWTGTPAEA
jgi:hypothetical protein